MLQDVRLALRRMRRNPLFAISAAGTLAVGVAATTSIYSVVDGVLLKPLPFPDADVARARHVRLPGARDCATSGCRSRSSMTSRARRRVRVDCRHLADHREPDRLRSSGARRSAPHRLELLRHPRRHGPPSAGPSRPRDEIPGIATVAVISDGLWRRGFGGDPQIVGRTLRIDEDVYEVVGVMPPTFRHPSVTLETDVEVWAPSGWKACAVPAAGLQRALRRVGDRSPRAGRDGRRMAARVSNAWRRPSPANIRTTTRRDSDGRRTCARLRRTSSPTSGPP